MTNWWTEMAKRWIEVTWNKVTLEWSDRKPNLNCCVPCVQVAEGCSNGSLSEADQWFDQELPRDLVQLLSKNSQKVFQFLSTSARNVESSSSQSNHSSPTMFFSAQLLSFLLAALGPGIKNSIKFQSLDCTNILSIGLNQYSKYKIESIFQVLDCTNILSIELNQYSKY